MRFLFTIIFLTLHLSSYSQNVIWKQYIDDNNKDDMYPYLHTHGNNHFIFSMTENYPGSKANDDYVISMTKTTFDGELLWTKYYRPGGSSYKFFGLNNVIIKDSIILIYGSCNDTFSYDYKFICELSLDGEERFSKVFSLRSDNSEYHASLSDSNTIEYVYDDHKLNKYSHIELYNKKHELIHTDSSYMDIPGSSYRVNSSNIYVATLFNDLENKLGIKMYRFDKGWNSIDSFVLTTDIKMFPVLTPRFHFSRFGNINKNNELAIWGVYDYSNTEHDIFYLKINVITHQLLECYYTRKNPNVKFSVHHNSILYAEHMNSNYSLYRIYNKDSTDKYKFRLVKFKNSNEIWNVDFDVQSFLNIFSTSVSLDFKQDKILAVINYDSNKQQLGEWVLEYDTNGNYIRSFYGKIDTNCISMSHTKTFYLSNLELLSLYRMRLKGREDGDLSWRKISFEPTGFTSTASLDVNVYPNPANKSITLTGLEDLDFSVEVYDLLGNRLVQKSNESTVDIDSLSTGMYILKVNTSKGMVVMKFFKE